VKVKIPVDKDKQVIIYTKDIFVEEEINRLMEFMHAVDWTKKWLMLPSEYVEKVEFI